MIFRFNQFLRLTIIVLCLIGTMAGCSQANPVETKKELQAQIAEANEKQDFETAVVALKKLIQIDDNPQYKTLLGDAYINGFGVEKNENEGIRWIQEAANQGDPEAQYMMAGISSLGLGGVKQDILETINWLEKAAVQNYPEAIYSLGIEYYDGKHLTQSDQKAFEMMARAAKLNFPNAQGVLGQMYLNGIGVKKELNQGLKWIQVAAENNDSHSQELLGHFYETGTLVPKNIYTAIDWYHKAIAQNNTDAMFRLGVLYVEGEKVPANIDDALVLLTKAAELNQAESMEVLIQIYTEFPDLKYRSVEKADYWQAKLQQLPKELKNTNSEILIDLDPLFNDPAVKVAP